MSRPKKRYGQHFLHDPGTIDRIVRAIELPAWPTTVGSRLSRNRSSAPVASQTYRSSIIDLQNDFCASGALEVPDGVGGRFSVLSAVGLFSAGMCGIDFGRNTVT